MTDRIIIKTDINRESHGEDNPAEHPLNELTFDEIKEHIAQLEQEFAGYTELKYESDRKYYGRGGIYSEWYNLVGKASPLIKALK